MITPLQEKSLFKLSKEVGGQINSSGGDIRVNEALNSIARRENLTTEEVEHLRITLIKQIPGYRG